MGNIDYHGKNRFYKLKGFLEYLKHQTNILSRKSGGIGRTCLVVGQICERIVHFMIKALNLVHGQISNYQNF